jgi:hypothetical protein
VFRHPPASHPPSHAAARRPALRPRARAALALGLAAAAPAAVLPHTSLAQQELPMMTRGEKQAEDADRAALAALGIDLAVIESASDPALLWRAVRELVLPGRVSEATQRRILRRVWVVDQDIATGSYVDSQSN